MESPVSQTFPCPECGKKLKWKPVIAGKTGRCGCGAKFRAPDSIESPEEEDLLYGLAAPPGAVLEPVVAASVPSGQVLEYVGAHPRMGAGQSPIVPGGSADLLHEIYIPAGVLGLGFVLILAFLGFEGTLLPGVATAAVLVAGVMMVIKTVVLSLIAWSIVKNSGGSFGNPLTTFLKIAALIVLLDATLLWTWVLMKQTGVIAPNGRFYIVSTVLLILAVYTVVAAVVTQVGYRLDGSEANLFSRFLAVGNLAMNVLIVVVLVIVLQAMMNVARHKRGISTPAPALITVSIGEATGARMSGPPTGPTNADQIIARRISAGSPIVTEGMEWKQSSFLPDKQKRPIEKLIDQLYDAGAVKVYVDLGGNPTVTSAVVYAELPEAAAKRMACALVASQYSGQNAPVPLPTGRFMKIESKP